MSLITKDTIAIQIDMVTNAILGKMDNLSKRFDKLERRVKATKKEFKQLKPMFDMNSLSWMFGGMALQRMSLTVMRFLIPSMEILEKVNDRAARKVMGLAAAFEFLKISIFETVVNTPLFEAFVKGFADFVDWVTELTQKNPALLEVVLNLAAVGVILGTLAMGVGVFKQLAFLLELMGYSATTGAVTGAGVAGGFKKLDKLLLGGLAIKTVWDLGEFLTGKENLSKTLSDLGINLTAAGLIMKSPWLISIGVVLDLIPFGEQIANFGKNMKKSGWERIQNALKDKGKIPTIRETAGDFFNLFRGGTEMGLGEIIGSSGDAFNNIDKAIKNYDNAAEKAKTTTNEIYETFDISLIPAIDTATSKLSSEKGTSLTSSITDVNNGLDFMSGSITDDFVTATNTRVASIEKEVAAYVKLNEARKKYTGTGTNLRNQILSGNDRTSSITPNG